MLINNNNNNINNNNNNNNNKIKKWRGNSGKCCSIRDWKLPEI